MAGQEATSLQGISSYGRRNQSLYATEMHLSLAWTSLLWFHGVWYGLSLSVFTLCYSSSAKTDERYGAFKWNDGFVSIQRLSSTMTDLETVICFVCVHLRAYFGTCVRVYTGIHRCEHARTSLSHESLQLHQYVSIWFGLMIQRPPSFSLVHWEPICINLNAEQMDGTAVALRCPPSSLLMFETAVWAYVPIMSSSDMNLQNSSLIST